MAKEENIPTELKQSTDNKLKRNLKVRHIGMIALGGVIGTGLFQSIGGTIKSAGPGGALLAYGVIGIMVFFIMSGLGEMSTKMPITGSFETYSEKFIDKSFAFAMGWNYWFMWATTIAAELVGAELTMKYFLPNVPGIVWCLLFLVLIVGLNMLSAKGYGESEYWFAGIKVITVILFLALGILMIFGVFSGKFIGLKNFTVGSAPFVGGFKQTFIVFLAAGFAFQGEEMLGVTSGESMNPTKSIKKAVNSIFWRVLIFYIGAIFVVGCLIPYTSASLDQSPFTVIFQNAGIPAAAAIMNIVILTAVLSCGNSGMYASSRMLFAMAREHRAPQFLGRANKRGVPVPAVLLTTLIAALCLLTAFVASDTVYAWLIDASALCGFIAWLGIAICHFRFRRGYIKKGYNVNDLKFKAGFFPLGPILTIIVMIVVIVGQCIYALTSSSIDWVSLVASNAAIPLFLILWFVHKAIYKTKIVKLADIDFENAQKDEFSEEVVEDPEPISKVQEAVS